MRDFLVSEIGWKRFLCMGLYVHGNIFVQDNMYPNFPLTEWQYFTTKVVTHPEETSFKDCCKET